jgi:hypothetical protein
MKSLEEAPAHSSAVCAGGEGFDAPDAASASPPQVQPEAAVVPASGVPLVITMMDTFSLLVDSVTLTDKMVASATAIRAEQIEAACRWKSGMLAAERDSAPSGLPHGWDADVRSRRELSNELACALRIPERTAERLIAESCALVNDFPETMLALREGRVSYRHAQALLEQAWSLPEGSWAEFERHLIPYAERLTVSKFTSKARIKRELIHPESVAARRASAVSQRDVTLTPADDGMAWLTQYQPAEVAVAAYNCIDDIARRLKDAGDPRTLAQVRADVAADLAIDGDMCAASSASGGAAAHAAGGAPDLGADGMQADSTPFGHGIRAQVFVTVPALTLLGHADEPALLKGYGPISPEVATKLTASAPGFHRVLTDPITGMVLSVGRKSYKPPAFLKRLRRLIDATCRFPGCNKRAESCDIDHTVAWEHGGETTLNNLACMCPGHHNVKHHTRWAVENLDDARMKWTSPAGKVFFTEPSVRVRPANPGRHGATPIEAVSDASAGDGEEEMPF